MNLKEDVIKELEEAVKELLNITSVTNGSVKMCVFTVESRIKSVINKLKSSVIYKKRPSMRRWRYSDDIERIAESLKRSKFSKCFIGDYLGVKTHDTIIIKRRGDLSVVKKIPILK